MTTKKKLSTSVFFASSRFFFSHFEQRLKLKKRKRHRIETIERSERKRSLLSGDTPHTVTIYLHYKVSASVQNDDKQWMKRENLKHTTKKVEINKGNGFCFVCLKSHVI